MRLLRWIEKLSAIGGGIASLSILLMAGLILTEILTRSVFGVSTLIAEEYGAYLLVLFASLALASTLQAEGHIRVDLLLSKLSGGKKRIVHMVSSAIGFIVFLFMSYQAWNHFYGSWTSQETSMYSSKTPLWLPQLPLFIGCVLMTLQFLCLIANQYRSCSTSKTEEGSA